MQKPTLKEYMGVNHLHQLDESDKIKEYIQALEQYIQFLTNQN